MGISKNEHFTRGTLLPFIPDLCLLSIVCMLALMAAFKVVHYQEIEPQVAIICGYLARSAREYGQKVSTL